MSIENAVERIHRLATTRAQAFESEEAVKAALIMPFLAGLGHDPFDPDQVVAGYRIGTTKVDFATIDNAGEPKVLISVTTTPEDLGTGPARNLTTLLAQTGEIGVLTDGRVFSFHALDAGREMVSEPFLKFDLKEYVIDAAILQPLSRDGYDLTAAIAAGRMTKLPIVAFEALISQLSEQGDLHAMFAGAIVPGGVATDASRIAVTEAFDKAARILRGEESALPREPESETESDDEEGRVLSGDEEAAFQEIRRIASKHIDPSRIHARPAKAYLAVLLDDNNRRTISRLYFSAFSSRYVSTFKGRNEAKKRISGYADIIQYEQEILDRLRELDPGAFVVNRSVIEEPPVDSAGLDSGISSENPERTADADDALGGQQAEITTQDEDAGGETSDETVQTSDDAPVDEGADEVPEDSILHDEPVRSSYDGDLLGRDADAWRNQ